MQKAVGAIVGCAIVLLGNPARAEWDDVKMQAAKYVERKAKETPTEFWYSTARAIDSTDELEYEVANRFFQKYCSVQRSEKQVLTTIADLTSLFDDRLKPRPKDFDVQSNARRILYVFAADMNCVSMHKDGKLPLGWRDTVPKPTR
jgi:hypothetical protein